MICHLDLQSFRRLLPIPRCDELERSDEPQPECYQRCPSMSHHCSRSDISDLHANEYEGWGNRNMESLPL